MSVVPLGSRRCSHCGGPVSQTGDGLCAVCLAWWRFEQANRRRTFVPRDEPEESFKEWRRAKRTRVPHDSTLSELHRLYREWRRQVGCPVASWGLSALREDDSPGWHNVVRALEEDR